MHTQQLTTNQLDRPHDVERSEEAAIWGEIARHLLDAKEATSAARASAMLSKLHALSLVHPEALWMTVSLLLMSFEVKRPLYRAFKVTFALVVSAPAGGRPAPV